MGTSGKVPTMKDELLTSLTLNVRNMIVFMEQTVHIDVPGHAKAALKWAPIAELQVRWNVGLTCIQARQLQYDVTLLVDSEAADIQSKAG